MKTWAIYASALAFAAMSALAASAQTKTGVDKLYIINCGEGVAGDISRWSPGVNVGKSMDFVDNCYLIHHTQGWLLWDTGITDAIAAKPDGEAPADPRMTHWRRPKTLASQLEMLGVKPADIKYVAVSTLIPTISATSKCSRRQCCWCRRQNMSGRARSVWDASSRSIR